MTAPLATFRRRIATATGAVLLGLAALMFAALGDMAQRTFALLVRVSPYSPLFLSPAMFAFVAYVTTRYVPNARESGIPQVIAASRMPASTYAGRLVSLRVAAAKLALTLVILLAGGSAGREGPTVQTSAAIMTGVHRLFRVPITQVS